MKRIFLILIVLMVTGCNNKNYITCNIDIDNDIQNYTLTGTYKIYYRGNYVKKIEKHEKYISSDKYVLDYFNETKELEYYNLNDKYGGVDYNIKRTESNIDINITIDLNVLDVSNMAKSKDIDKNYVIGSKLTKNGIKDLYESRGAICK